MMCDRRLCAFTRPASRAVWLIGIISTLMLFGCATRIPGGEPVYCTDTDRNEQLNAQFEYARFDYGRFKQEPVSANSGICNFQEYHELKVRWKRKNDVEREHLIDIAQSIDELKEREKGWFPTGWSEIQFRYEEPFLKIRIKIVSNSYPIKRRFYPLYQFEMR